MMSWEVEEATTAFPAHFFNASVGKQFEQIKEHSGD